MPCTPLGSSKPFPPFRVVMRRCNRARLRAKGGFSANAPTGSKAERLSTCNIPHGWGCNDPKRLDALYTVDLLQPLAFTL